MSRLIPHDPNEEQPDKKAKDAGKTEHHYHYYDHRTFDSRPQAIEEPEKQEPASEPILLPWQKAALAVIGILAIIWLASLTTVTTVTNTVTEVNTTTYTEDSSLADVIAGVTQVQCEGTYVFVAPKDGPAADYVTHSVRFGRGRLEVVRTDNSGEVQAYRLDQLTVTAGDGTQYWCMSDGSATEQLVTVSRQPVSLDLRRVPQSNIWAYLKANGLLERYVLADSQREPPTTEPDDATPADDGELVNIAVPNE